MRGRMPSKFAVKPKDKRFLQELLQDGQTPLRLARRAEILLGRAAPQQRLVRLSEKVEEHPSTVWRVCERYRQHGLPAALYDAPRPGRPRVFSPERAPTD
jgi:CRISPR/Cas system-associated protein endoribonuclease Cas2